jgi:hypothetical protein
MSICTEKPEAGRRICYPPDAETVARFWGDVLNNTVLFGFNVWLSWVLSIRPSQSEA